MNGHMYSARILHQMRATVRVTTRRKGSAMTNSEMLAEAARLIMRCMNTLDRSLETCDHCGVTRNPNWTEAKMHTQLIAVNAKLNRFARQLRGEE